MAKKAKSETAPCHAPVIAPAEMVVPRTPVFETLKIVVPSHRRWDLLTTHKAVDIDAVCIPESQLAQYRAHNPQLEYVTHPDSVVGLHAKRVADADT